MKEKNKRIGIIVTVVVMLLTVFGVTYAFINYTLIGNKNSVLVTGDIYMNYTENNQINLENAVPMAQESALKLSDNIFNFTISGKNQSRKDIYYGISIVYGEEQETKTRLKDEDIDVYLTSGEDVLVNANRYKTLNDTRIWVEKINAGTNSYNKDYSLRLWIDESVTVSDTNGDYTQEVWNNSYASYKVKVDGNLNEMNIPLSVDNKDTYYEHGEEYILVNISNYLNPHEAGLSLASLDTMKLEITSSNPDLMFTYTDSEEGSSSDKKNSLDLTYSFNENKVISIKVFPTSNSYSKIDTDINIKLTKNDKETFEMLKRIHIDEITSTCIKKGYNNLSDCLLITEQMGASNVNEAKEAIKAKGEADITKTSEQANENGMYKTVDNDGDTYFYRGDVKNNNVKFAGFYWKIIRVNGDGSIRLIYGNNAGTTGHEASINGAAYKFNLKTSDPTYVGYMYGENFSNEPIKSDEGNFSHNSFKNTKYYFGKGYTSDASSRTFKLTDADYVGTLTEWNIANKLNEGYKYTCLSTTEDGTCDFLMEIIKFNSEISVQAYYYSYSSASYEGTRENTISSNAKIELERWYNNILSTKNELGINAVNYISNDATFCNDRSLSTQGDNGNGFSLVPVTYYGAYDRFVYKHTASLVCPDVEHDLFSAKGSSGKGNQKLEKPIGLPTADEVVYAGGLYNTKNEKYYLVSKQYYWLMTPMHYGLWGQSSSIFDFYHNGTLNGGNVAIENLDLRAVINLKSDVLVKNGTGTIDDPYTIKLAS